MSGRWREGEGEGEREREWEASGRGKPGGNIVALGRWWAYSTPGRD